MATNRRTFMKLLSSGALSAALPSSIERALALPANNRTGTIADVEHIVVQMQENRAFDHYFGTLSGVRGFGDPRVAKFPNGWVFGKIDCGSVEGRAERRADVRSESDARLV